MSVDYCIINLAVRVRICTRVDVRRVRDLGEDFFSLFFLFLAERRKREVDSVPFVCVCIPLLRERALSEFTGQR